ncbi:hypothetical protein SAMN02745163_01667 [Clostridium cavendishii DSM 21758]|uniref:Uncharacterized protein n=1 Tax=Clostridium cavendishii DSM 21758 TaxID=1121302 RepID=A0A1M6I2N4_9CLOT|nr:hypothetical protein [Clostridium cavendishii]SHJ28514.1 hypothetical protein SAMN02745163_01667 [Clostridium cavendishii DSM 21758]
MGSNNLIIDKLQNLFSELSLVLVANRRGDIDYHISEVKYVVKILNECKKNNYTDSGNIINEIKSIYNNLYSTRGGLSDFFIWKADFDERIKANEPLDRIGDEIWKILK